MDTTYCEVKKQGSKEESMVVSPYACDRDKTRVLKLNVVDRRK